MSDTLLRRYVEMQMDRINCLCVVWHDATCPEVVIREFDFYADLRLHKSDAELRTEMKAARAAKGYQ